jgi:hypothetical protein
MADWLPTIARERVLRPHLALVSEAKIPRDDLLSVAAAVQRQLTEDVAPFWGASGTVSVFDALEEVPPSYWPIIVGDEFAFPSLGFHQDVDGKPLALIKHSDSYSQAVSHEAIEMVVDGDGGRLLTAPALDGDGQSEYLLEVCDPCEAQGYAIDGILVSDFYTPRYFDDEAQPGVRYCFTGEVKEPRQVLDGGYLTWRTPGTDEWWQHRCFGESQGTQRLADLPGGDASLRAKVDSVTRSPAPQEGLSVDSPLLREALKAKDAMKATSAKRATTVRQLIAELQCDGRPSTR